MDELPLSELTPTQAHFLKKYLLEQQLSKELSVLNEPNCCELLGLPFKCDKPSASARLPLLRFFFREFVVTFPLITNNEQKEQRRFWQEVVQPFVASFNSKELSGSDERKSSSKRRKVNNRLLSLVLLFFNSTFVVEGEMTYLRQDHLKASDTAKLDKFNIQKQDAHEIVGLTDYNRMSFHHGVAINVVAVRTVENEQRSWFSSQKGQHNYEFIIHIVLKNEKEPRGHRALFVNKYYGQFRTLETELKKELPGVMSTIIPPLPLKEKHDDGFDEADAQGVLAREKSRMALRGYLRELIKNKEVTNSFAFQSFISTNLTKMFDSDMRDYEERVKHELNILHTQVEFQKQTTAVMTELSKNVDQMKSQLIKNPNTITSIFEEISSTKTIKEASPLLRTFNDWGKLEIAATVYQLFLGQDNCNEFYHKVRKFHRLFPYSIIYAILRFTNPMKMITRIVDVLFVNIPRLPTWNKELNDHSKQTGARNLMAIIFVSLLNEDLNAFEKETAELRKQLVGYELYLQRIDEFTKLSINEVQDIKEEASAASEDYFLTILQTSLIEKPPVPPDSNKSGFAEIVESQRNFDRGGAMEQSLLYLNLKQYWQLKVRTRDKNLLKQLWEEPEMTQLLKTFLQVFYNPVMRVFAKSNIHKAFASAEKLIDDLLATTSEIREEQYYLSPLEIYDRIKDVLDKHEDLLWNFLHDVYANDDQHVFLKFIQWIEKILTMMRVKFDNEQAATLSIRIANVNKELFLRQLDAMAHATLEKRRLFKEYLESKNAQQEQINRNWDDINNNVFGNPLSGDFGFSPEDLQDVNQVTLEDKLLETEPSTLEKDLIAKLNALKTDAGTSELDKVNIEEDAAFQVEKLEEYVGKA
ncbi:uncharacterized protein LODBEIA_P53090 [Lodderomyces beijingensis]|uniref:PX domain-containing protein n=1 Tax=Lodderomyces beijingensis TaxID=1775926 RepID=A0ABP0ZWC6_9ASCO